MINSEEETWLIDGNMTYDMSRCNHEEADTRLVLHAAMTDSPAVIIAKDTDVLILLIYAMSKLSTQRWYMKIDHEKYVNVDRLVKYYGTDLCSVLPQFHAITGCDTTAYKFRVGKVNTFKKIVKNEKLRLFLHNVGKEVDVKEMTIISMKRFFQLVLYCGKDDEDYVDTRVRMYTNMKVKSSAPLMPDPDSLLQEIKRIHLQCFYWLNCLEYFVKRLDVEEYGWKIEDEYVKPVWFTGKQYPHSFIKRKTKEKDIASDHSIKVSKSNVDSHEPLEKKLKQAIQKY